MSEINKNKTKVKKVIKTIIISLVFFIFSLILFINHNSHLQNLSQETQNDKTINFQSIEIIPYKVKVGEKQTTTVKIKSTEEIEKVFAQIPFEGSYDEVSLKLISGDNLNGTWQCEWIAHNTLTKEYTTTITAITKNSIQEKITSTWWDDTETTWLQGWQERRKVTITETSGSTLTDYQVPIDMTTALYDNSNLRGSWHFSEGTGTFAKDSSGNNKSGEIIDATWTTNKEGEATSALSFNGTSAYVSLPQTGMVSGSSNATLAVWFKTTDTSGAIWAQYSMSGTYGYKLNIDDSKLKGCFGTTDDSCTHTGDFDVSYDTNVNDGNWHYAAMTYDGSNIVLYMDGVQRNSAAKTGNISYYTTYGNIVGSMGYIYSSLTTQGNGYLAGDIDEARIYNRTLSEAEIKQLYGEGRGRLDMNDLRFTSADGITELSYWTEGDNKVWVKIPTLSASSDTNIYYYFGNLDASGVSSTTNTFIREIDSLVGGWSFSEGSGTTTRDSSGNGNNGTISSATWTSDRYGNTNSALSFDGSDDYVDYGSDSSLDITDEISISVWMKYSSIGSGCLLGKGDPLSYYFGTANSGSTVRFREGTTNYDATASHGYSTGEWHNLILVLDQPGGTIKFYSDGGQLGDTVTISNSLTSDDDTARSGIIDSFLDRFNGVLDDIYFYNGILDSSEISDIYNNAVYSTSDYPNKSLIYKYNSSEPTYSISAQEESKPTRSGTTGVSGGGPLMF